MKKYMLLALVVLGLISQTASAEFDITKILSSLSQHKTRTVVLGSLALFGLWYKMTNVTEVTSYKDSTQSQRLKLKLQELVEEHKRFFVLGALSTGALLLLLDNKIERESFGSFPTIFFKK